MWNPHYWCYYYYLSKQLFTLRTRSYPIKRQWRQCNESFPTKNTQELIECLFRVICFDNLFFSRRTWSEKTLAIFLSLALITEVKLVRSVVKLSRGITSDRDKCHNDMASAVFEVCQSLALMSVRIVTHCRCLSWKVTEVVLGEISRKIRTSHQWTVDKSFVTETNEQRSAREWTKSYSEDTVQLRITIV